MAISGVKLFLMLYTLYIDLKGARRNKCKAKRKLILLFQFNSSDKRLYVPIYTRLFCARIE